MLGRVFGNLEWQATDRSLLQGEAMLEHHYFTGTDISPRVAFNYTRHPGHTLRFSVSQACRSPTVYEQDGNVATRDIDGTLVNRTNPVLHVAPARAPGFSRNRLCGQLKSHGLNWNARLFYDTLSDYIGPHRILTHAPCASPAAGSGRAARSRLRWGD